ncbi:hypothetical protein [Streptomyces halobius]|uniref:Penicillinase repressor n=1 Tax=Streptomyces halobius TaxID=2879846 RepID=A0ABY4LYS3_9ACTN|nr:hypothetical protein [Streptomyces halobius]UQA90636.1 hypothetical protein K9S39_00825 [Streptomyces halobius]
MAAKLKSITKEINELQKLKAKLEDLQHHLGTGSRDETVTSPPPEADTGVTESAAVPPPRRATTAVPKAQPTKKAAAKAAGSPKKPRKTASVKGKGRQKSPTRADRLLGLLNEQPRTVAEMTKLLAQEHPQHAAPETAVRNTLENSLVARGLAHRSKQGRSVFYSRPAPEPKSGIEAPEADAANVSEDGAPAMT